VVVHFGAAEFGHYFSYIDIQRDRDSKESKWFEFNDSKVKDFKPSNIENECFGGASTNTDNEDFGWWKSNRENSQNAYILVYEKTEKTPIKIECNDQAHLDAVQQQFNLQFISQTAREDGKIEASIDYYGLPRYVPENLASVVQRENQQFQLERSLYDSEFFGFLNEVCKCYELPDVDLK
jgi:ubiquitin carboxyl-terminal hydrolase 34